MIAKRLNSPLTEEEKQLVEQYHNLIFPMLRKLKDYELEYYGEAALALMDAARRYLQDTRLHQWSFATIAASRIRSTVGSLQRSKKKAPICISLDITVDGKSVAEAIPAPRYEQSKEVPEAYWTVISKLTERQLQIVEMYAAGVSITEIAAVLGEPRSTVESILYRARKRLLPLADELFGQKKSALEGGNPTKAPMQILQLHSNPGKGVLSNETV